ncbi:MAG: hypothetical protein QXF48_02815 [Candidatus Anstonellaceae archaeon]
MVNFHNIKRIVFLYIFWFFFIAFIWVVGEYFLFGKPFYSSVYFLNTYTPTAFVYAAFLAVAFAIFQYILSPRPISTAQLSSPTQTNLQSSPSTQQTMIEEKVEPQVPVVVEEEKRPKRPKKRVKKIKSKKKIKK